MIDQNKDFLKTKLDQRRKKNNFRRLNIYPDLVDFSSNDYLGLSRDKELFEIIKEETDQLTFIGSTGSRLISGNSVLIQELEESLADLFKSEGSLIFNSGYVANQTLMASLGEKGDTILYDQLSHACIKEGAWLSKADSYSFQHNDLEHLNARLKSSNGVTFVVTESLFSMDGDFSPIVEILSLCKKYGAHLIVDEAHTTGVYGKNGSGWLDTQIDVGDVFARVYTFGKAVGAHGACVVGSRDLMDYLINFGRGFIYTTAPSPHQVLSIKCAFDFIRRNPHLSSQLSENIQLYKDELEKLGHHSKSETAIQPIFISGNSACKLAADKLHQMNFDVRAILSPTVKEGDERLRVCLHNFNNKSDISILVKALSSFL